jgi:hypothetical protein
MFVSKDLDHKWIGNYLKKKHLALSHLIGKQETTSLYFSLTDFSEVIDRLSAVNGASGVRIYFATYCSTGNPDVDAIVRSGWMDQLTLFFAATDNQQNDLGHYFLIKPTGGVLPLSLTTATILAVCYQAKKIPFLTTIIKDAGLPGFKESRSLWYPLANFNGPNDIVKEMRLHGAAGITAFIGSYGEKETTRTGLDISWQLNIIFELVRTVTHDGSTYYYHFDLENTEGWEARPDPFIPEGADTGNPCPPATCGSGLG